jgi:CheY-like chemotaxis protein
MHGGTIEASSEGLGLGATFRLRLPLTAPRSASEERRKPGVPPPRVERVRAIPDLHDVHVLAVDDDRDALTLVSEVLEAAGARVTTASSATEALSALDAEVPDVVIADLGMPQMNGFELIERIKRHPDPRVRELPSAALTAFARSDDRQKAIQTGFRLHIAKPIDPADLMATVAALAKPVVEARVASRRSAVDG